LQLSQKLFETKKSGNANSLELYVKLAATAINFRLKMLYNQPQIRKMISQNNQDILYTKFVYIDKFNIRLPIKQINWCLSIEDLRSTWRSALFIYEKWN